MGKIFNTQKSAPRHFSFFTKLSSFCVSYSRHNTYTIPIDLYFVFCVCILFLPLFWWCFVSIVITCTIPMDASLNREESPWQNCPNEKKWKIKTSNYLFFYKISFEDNNSKSPQVGCNLFANLKHIGQKLNNQFGCQI